MPWTAGDIPTQVGRVAVVTGANAGLGLETARALAGAGAHVVIAARDLTRAEVAQQAIASQHGAASLEIVPLDLASLASVEACAATILRVHDRIDLLVNNGGLMGTPAGTTAEGFELQLGTNHLGHFVLTSRLLPGLLRAPGSRVVTVTSFAHLIGRTVDPANPHLRDGYGPWVAYAQSKLANLQFAVELDRRLAAAGAQTSSLAAHPGLASTGLQAASVSASGGGWSQRLWHVLARSTGMAPARAALPQLRALTDPAARGGDLFAPRMFTRGPPVRRRPPRHSCDPSRTRTLWQVSDRETGVAFDVAAIVGGVG